MQTLMATAGTPAHIYQDHRHFLRVKRLRAVQSRKEPLVCVQRAPGYPAMLCSFLKHDRPLTCPETNNILQMYYFPA